MKIKIGPTTNDFQILDDEGNDLTSKMLVYKIAFQASAYDKMSVVMEVGAEVEISLAEEGRRILLGERGKRSRDESRLVTIVGGPFLSRDVAEKAIKYLSSASRKLEELRVENEGDFPAEREIRRDCKAKASQLERYAADLRKAIDS